MTNARATTLIFAAFGATLCIFWGCFAEDAFIVARYAANLVDGKGLTYNVGERITALTSPAHAFVLAFFQKAFSRAVEPFAIATGIGMAALLWYGVPRLFKDPQRREWFLVATLLFPAFGFWTIGGLETPLLTAVAIALLIAWNDESRGRSTAAIGVVMLAASAFLTRYDSVLLFGVPTLYVVYRQRRDFRVWLGVALAASICVGWLAFSQIYFGDVLPTSFYQKNPIETNADELLRGALYEVSLLTLLALPLIPLFAFGARRLPADEGQGLPMWPLVAALALHFAYGLSAGVKHMMYLYRAFVPCIPWLMYVLIRHARVVPPRAALGAAVCLQIAMAFFIYFESLNFNVTLPFVPRDPLGNGIFEFGNVGARYNMITDRVFADQAKDIRAHWASVRHDHGAGPRVYSLTGGQPPYELLEMYVYDSLTGFRKHCRADFAASAHYRQYITWMLRDKVELGHAPGAPWQRIAYDDTPIVDLDGTHAWIRIAWYYQPNPKPHPLPPTIDGPCRPVE